MSELEFAIFTVFVVLVIAAALAVWGEYRYRQGYQDGLKDSSFQELPY